MDLFSKSGTPPLAERIRPVDFTTYIGQQHIVAPDGPLRRMILSGRLNSVIFWGPPGVGKTTLARIIAKEMGRPFRQLSAVQAGVKDVREVIQFAKARPGTLLFIDEIHRFSKSQQDSLLGAVEQGIVNLIGATTENPSFEVNSALLSRCQVYNLKPLTQTEVEQLLNWAIESDQILKNYHIELKETQALYRLSGGDARKALNLLELVVNAAKEDRIDLTDDRVVEVAHTKVAIYDKNGENHYDIISAFIKSVRGSDPHAAVYWLARMLVGGEDVKFIARRLIILASEDIGNANPNALLLANACFEAVNKIGMPEARIILSQTTTYLACSAKSNAAYLAINEAMELVRQTGDLPVPMAFRNAPTKLMKNMGYGQGYKYSHDYSGKDGNQDYLPAEISGTQLYSPTQNGREKEFRSFLQEKWGEQYSVK